jgi:hypothetical protein
MPSQAEAAAMPDPVDEDVPRLDRRRPDYQALRCDGTRCCTIRETAFHVRGSEAYVRKLIALGLLRAVRPTPRKTLIPETEICRFLGITCRG